MKRLLIVLLVLALLYAAAEVLTTSYAERTLAAAAAAHDPAARDAEAEVSFPFLLPLITRSLVDRVEVQVEHADVGAFLADRITVVFEGVELDRSESFKRREVVVEAIDRVEAEIAISASEASKILPEGFRFMFARGVARLVGPGFDSEVRFRVTGQSTIGFEPASGRLPRGVPSSLEFSKVTLVNCFDGVKVEGDLLVVTCSQDDPPAWVPA